MGINPDFKALFFELCDADARFIVVGAHAVVHHTVPRYTKDLDIWVEPTEDNATEFQNGGRRTEVGVPKSEGSAAPG